MSWKVNQSAVEHAKSLIEEGKYILDSDWSEVQPSTDDENQFQKKNGWSDYGKWFLAYDPSESEETKGRYGFPYGDFKVVHRSGLNAVQQRAGQYDYNDIEKAGDELVTKMDKKEEK